IMDDEREEEITSLSSIFPEIVVDKQDAYTMSLLIPVAPTEAVSVVTEHCQDAGLDASPVTHLPPLQLRAKLPPGYPDSVPPRVQLEAKPAWINAEKLQDLESECEKLWEEYGRCQILYTYIDHVQQAAERFFDLPHTITVKPQLKEELVEFSRARDKEIFERSSYDCGVCLEPKKGTLCHRMSACGHVFCRACLQDFYNSAITEGDVGNISCLEPSCGKGKPGEPQQKRKPIHPGELLVIGVEEAQARRYVELKRKKKLESDKSTIYCPRTWCQAPARSNKYPPIPDDLNLYVDDSSDESSDPPPAYTKDTPENKLPVPADRLAICSNPKCLLAFCRVCYCGWHGEFARCWPRNPADLSEEEKASYDYIRQHTSPCPTCSSPVQKTMGCNHMKCFQCNTHFCYLCGAWLEPGNPYQHFNQKGLGCYMRLWELEEGDDGQGNAHFQGARRDEMDRRVVGPGQQGRGQGRGRRGRGQNGPHPPNVNGGQRGGRGARGLGGAVAAPGQVEEREAAALRRFVQMAQNDQEDEWDSDEL
ncbi:RWD domain-containing protein, partial [Elsinoe ampelina]